MSMTVNEIKVEIKKLEEKIAEMLIDFEDSAGVKVVGLDLPRWEILRNADGSYSRVRTSNLTLEVQI